MNVLTDAQREAMRRRLADAGIAAGPGITGTPAAPEPVADDGRLGIAERRMWKIHELDPESDAHNFAVQLEFGDTYSVETVVASTERLIASSQVLRSVIEVVDGVPRRRPAPRSGRWVVPGEVWEWGAIPAGAETTATLAKIPFRLTEEQPGRIRIRRHDAGVSMVLVLHHLAGDETILPPVLGVLVADVDDEERRGSPDGHAAPSTAAAPVDPTTRTGIHADAAVRHAQQTWAGEGIRYPLSGQLPDTTPADSWVSVMGEGPGRLLTQPVPDDDVARLVAFARDVGATPNALFVALSALTVCALTEADDFVILVPADNRAPNETTDRVGYSGNIIPMRFSFDPRDRTGEALKKAVSTVYEAMEHSSVDYGTILTALRGSGGRFPVAEIMTLVKNAPLRGVAVPAGAKVTCETVFKDVVHYPLSLAFEFSEDDHVHLEIEYRTDVLDDAYAKRAAAVVAELTSQVPQSAEVQIDEFLQKVRAAA